MNLRKERRGRVHQPLRAQKCQGVSRGTLVERRFLFGQTKAREQHAQFAGVLLVKSKRGLLGEKVEQPIIRGERGLRVHLPPSSRASAPLVLGASISRKRMSPRRAWVLTVPKGSPVERAMSSCERPS